MVLLLNKNNYFNNKVFNIKKNISRCYLYMHHDLLKFREILTHKRLKI